jgi:CheY-like chemotaxis protein
MTDSDPEILVVEDSVDDLELTLAVLKAGKLANHIAVARDGEEALDYLFCRGAYAHRRFDQPPRLVLLDLKLPKLDGLEVLRAVKADPRTSAIPIVMMTASKEQRDVVNGYKLGVNSYIQKPMDFQQFRDTIRQIGLFWLVVNQPPPLAAFDPAPNTPAE